MVASLRLAGGTSFLWGEVEAGTRKRRARLPTPTNASRLGGTDPEQPGLELRFGAEAGEIAKELKEYLLAGIVDLVAADAELAEKRLRDRRVFAVEIPGRPAIALQASMNELGVRLAPRGSARAARPSFARRTILATRMPRRSARGGRACASVVCGASGRLVHTAVDCSATAGRVSRE